MANTVVGVYDNYSDAQQALSELTANGFSTADVKLSPEEESTDARHRTLTTEHGSGGLMGFFRSLFGMDDQGAGDASNYSEAVRRGSYLLTVQAQSVEQNDLATDIMNRHNPVDIDERSSQWKTQGWQQYDSTAPAYSDAEVQQERSSYAAAPGASETGTRTADTEKTAIPVIQEEMQIGKRTVQRGGVRVFRHVSETPVEDAVRLREEHVSIERHPVDQPATAADMSALKEESFEMRETAEEPVIAKVARVVEEVVIGKEVSERTETVTDNLRRSDVEVEKMGGGMQAGSTSPSGAAFDDSDYRTHWQNKYGESGSPYEDYAPAYQYGSQMANDDRYSKYRWADVEPDIQHDWEAGHEGHPWARVKDAVRYGWEKITK